MPFDIDLTASDFVEAQRNFDIKKSGWDNEPVDLPRLEDVTTEYLDNIAKRLQHDTFSEQSKHSYDEAWQMHYAQLETERKTKKWSHFRKKVTMDVYMSWSPKQRQAYTEKYGRRVQ